ncbi:hypothetical protein TNCV_3400201 [Trichonephila clavipes]|nr:hypothetical protein TNCV_3400201 [Trichonephila clavipes]
MPAMVGYLNHWALPQPLPFACVHKPLYTAGLQRYQDSKLRLDNADEESRMGLLDYSKYLLLGRNPAVYLQVDDHVHPGNCPAAVSSEKKQDLLHMEFYHHLPSWDMNGQMPYFSSVSDEWSRDLKSVQVQKQRSCRDESPDPSMSKIVLRDLIISSKYYKEEEAKELLEVITAERLETEQQQKLKRQEQLSIEKLRLEIELSRNANQSATQNNGQTSRVRSLDEIVKMVLGQCFSNLEKAFASEMVSDELKPKVLLCMLGDKVSNLLINLGEEELKDYESLKQVVLKEYEPSPKIC